MFGELGGNEKAGAHMDIWTTTLALGGFVVIVSVGAGMLGNRPAEPEPSRFVRLMIALLMLSAVLGAIVIAGVWLIRLTT